MRVAHPPIPNVVQDMLDQEKFYSERDIQDATDSQLLLAEIEQASADWREVAALSDHPGWAHLVKSMDQQIERLRAMLEKPIPDLPFRYVQGGIYALKWLARLPELAEATAMAAEEQARIVKTEMSSADDGA